MLTEKLVKTQKKLLGRYICKNVFDVACQNKPSANNSFCQISGPMVGSFSNGFLRINHEIEMVVLSAIKSTNGEAHKPKEISESP